MQQTPTEQMGVTQAGTLLWLGVGLWWVCSQASAAASPPQTTCSCGGADTEDHSLLDSKLVNEGMLGKELFSEL